MYPRISANHWFGERWLRAISGHLNWGYVIRIGIFFVISWLSFAYAAYLMFDATKDELFLYRHKELVTYVLSALHIGIWIIILLIGIGITGKVNVKKLLNRFKKAIRR